MSPPDLWASLVLAGVVAVSAVTDVRRGKVFNLVTLPAIAAGLAGQTILHGPGGLANALTGLLMGFVPMLVCWLVGGIRGGDVKLLAAVGALTSVPFVLAALMYAFLVAALMAIAVMVHKRIVVRTLKRIGRTLYLAVTPGRHDLADASDESSPRIPFAVATAVGVIGLLLDVWTGGVVTRTLLGM